MNDPDAPKPVRMGPPQRIPTFRDPRLEDELESYVQDERIMSESSIISRYLRQHNGADNETIEHKVNHALNSLISQRRLLDLYPLETTSDNVSKSVTYYTIP
jgi:glutathione S-transferase